MAGILEVWFEKTAPNGLVKRLPFTFIRPGSISWVLDMEADISNGKYI
jgi:hypothetical protein